MLLRLPSDNTSLSCKGADSLAHACYNLEAGLGSGVVVTKAPFINFSVRKIFDLKNHIRSLNHIHS